MGQVDKNGGIEKVASEQVSADAEKSRELLGVFAALLLVTGLLVLAVHWPCLSAGAHSFDDEQYLHKNRLVQNPSWASARRFFSEVLAPSTVGGYYQPLTMISLMVDYGIAGGAEDLRDFHVTSLGLHVLNTWLVIVGLLR